MERSYDLGIAQVVRLLFFSSVYAGGADTCKLGIVLVTSNLILLFISQAIIKE